MLFPSPGDLLNPGIKPGSPALQADSLPSEPPIDANYGVSLAYDFFASRANSLVTQLVKNPPGMQGLSLPGEAVPSL